MQTQSRTNKCVFGTNECGAAFTLMMERCHHLFHITKKNYPSHSICEYIWVSKSALNTTTTEGYDFFLPHYLTTYGWKYIFVILGGFARFLQNKNYTKILWNHNSKITEKNFSVCYLEAKKNAVIYFQKKENTNKRHNILSDCFFSFILGMHNWENSAIVQIKKEHIFSCHSIWELRNS